MSQTQTRMTSKESFAQVFSAVYAYCMTSGSRVGSVLHKSQTAGESAVSFSTIMQALLCQARPKMGRRALELPCRSGVQSGK